THKEGIGALFAHNHMVFPSRYEARIEGQLSHDNGVLQIHDALFQLRFPTAALVADEFGVQKAWFPRIQATAILQEPFPEISADNRVRIRAAMLGRDQLDAAT